MGLLKTLNPTMRFGIEHNLPVTRRYDSFCRLNPTSLWYSVTTEEGEPGPVVLVGCVHPTTSRCQECNVDPDADIKDDQVFKKQRAWVLCRLWNHDAYVNAC